MTEGIRYNAALAAAQEIIDWVDPRAMDNPELLSKLVDRVLDAIYRAEGDLAEIRQRQFVCVGCFKPMLMYPQHAGKKARCRACGQVMRLPEYVGCN